MEDCEGETECLKHSFLQMVSLSKQLLARNEVLKAKITEQEMCFEWKIAEMQKNIDDLKRKNSVLQKKLSIEDDDLNVVSKDYQEVLKNSMGQIEKDTDDFAAQSHEIYEKGKKIVPDKAVEDDDFEKESDSAEHSV
jgi:CHASE3 domain sensor protein